MKLNRIVGNIVVLILSVALLGAMFYQRAERNITIHPKFTANFFTFWLPGRMILDGENPYNEAQYLAGHDKYGMAWKPNKIFPYPLPLALLMVPLGLLPLSSAYFVWQLVTQAGIAGAVFILLGRWGVEMQIRLTAPMTIFFLFFGPVFLTLQIGSIGAIALIFTVGSMLLFEKQKSLAAGFVLALTLLKPPQGLTLLLLTGVWSLARKDWKALLGMVFGGLGILLIGMVQDPLWVLEFQAASQAVMDRTQGIQSNAWSYAYLACSGRSPCHIILGAFTALSLLGLGGFFLWRNHARLSAREVFNIIIPLGFVSTIYLWSYDQILYIIPIVWIVGTLIERNKNYFQAVLFIIVLELVAFAALALHAYTEMDLWNVGTTILVLGMFLWLICSRQWIETETIS